MEWKKTFTYKIAVTLATGMLLMNNQALAAEEPEFQLDQVTVTATRINEKVSDIPGNVTVITAKQLMQKGAKTLAEALSGVSGISVQSYGSMGQKAIVKILGSEEVAVLVDGKRMNLPQGIAYNGAGIDVNTILLGDNIEKIEVVRGGGSVLYGADAVGGVINIITKKGTGATKTTASAAGGNYGAGYYAFTADGEEKTKHWQLSAMQNSHDGQRLNSAYKDKNVSFRFDQYLQKTDSLSFTYDYFSNNAGLPGSLTSPKPNDYGEVVRRNWSVGYSREHAAGKRTLVYYDNDQVYSGYVWGSGFRHQNVVRAFDYQDSAKIGDADLLTWGGEWRRDKVVSSKLGNTPVSITKAFYVQNQHAFNPSAQVTFGLRRDDNNIYGSRWLPKVSLLYKANANTNYFANWGKVFKAPDFDDLYWPASGMGEGNPNLKAETGWTAEIGVKSKLSKVSEATVSLFRRNLDGYIKWAEGVDHVYRPYNVANYKSNGININCTTKLSKAVVADMGYTYLDSRDQNNASLGEPVHTFNIGLNIHSGKLSQSIAGVYYDKSGLGSQQVSSRFVVNANTTYALSKDTSLFLTVNNLLDRQYQAYKGYPADRRTVLLGVKQIL